MKVLQGFHETKYVEALAPYGLLWTIATERVEMTSLAIAAYTLVEFGIQIYDLIRLRKHRDPEAKALRLVSLCGILVSFALTQTAIMSFSEQAEHNFSDGLAGVVGGIGGINRTIS